MTTDSLPPFGRAESYTQSLGMTQGSEASDDQVLVECPPFLRNNLQTFLERQPEFVQ